MTSLTVMIGPDFYATAAQVLPALFLVIILERRMNSFGVRPDEDPGAQPWWAVTLAAVIGLAAAGQMAAVAGLAGMTSSFSERLIVIAIGACVSWVVARFLIDSFLQYAPATYAVFGLGSILALVVPLVVVPMPFIASVVIAILM